MTVQTRADLIRIPTDITRILVVEGPEDKTFFGGLANYLGIQKEIYIVVCNGKDNLKSPLASILNDGNFRNFDHIGIICDNDFPESRQGKGAMETVKEEIDSANDNVDKQLIARRQLPIPEIPRVPVGTKPKVSVLLLPNDERDGMLEDLVLEAIGKDEITDCVEGFHSCLAMAGLTAREARKPRSSLSVYISGKILDQKYATNDDSRRWFLTQAVDMKWWHDENIWNKPAFNTAKAFLKQLLA